MKKISTIFLLAIAFTFLVFSNAGAQIAGWHFTNYVGDEAQSVALLTAQGLQINKPVLTRGAGLTPVASNARGFHGTFSVNTITDFNTAKTAGTYYQVLIKIDNNYILDLATLNYRVRRSGSNAPQMFMWTYNVSDITDVANTGGSESGLVFTALHTEQTYIGYNGGSPDQNGGAVQSEVSLNIGDLQDLASTKVVRLRMYCWFAPTQTKNIAQTIGLGKSINNTTEYAVLSLGGTLENTLPVQLTSFAAKPSKNSVQLSWSTASEQNNSYFEILRSAKGQPDVVIGKVNGNGTTSTANQYHFTDYAPLASAYYQLRQVDYNGDSQKSEVVFVSVNLNQSTLVAGAGNGKLLANYQSNTASTANFSVVDLNGKVVVKKLVLLEKGANQIEVPVVLNKGLYLARLTESDGKTQSTKFIYQ